MNDSADLDVEIQRQAGAYTVDLRFNAPGSDGEVRPLSGGPSSLALDLAHLAALANDIDAYGRALGLSLLADPAVREAVGRARSVAAEKDVPLRVRLYVDPAAAELHSLRWETLRLPDDGAVLTTSERLLFSRYLSSYDWTPVRLRAQSALRALVVIANPSDLEAYNLDAIDVDAELARARASLEPISVTALAGGGAATLEAIAEALRSDCDILYVVCHGVLARGKPALFLENANGKAAPTPGEELVARLNALAQRPRLVVLASCQSAGSGDGASTDNGVLAALGPRLAEVGVPAVVAMQGNIRLQTIAEFMPVFFRELRRDGQIDRAMAAARAAVRGQLDWWAPVLFMRLKSGRIWYTPGFSVEGSTLDKWPTLLRSIRNQKCTLLLGPGLLETLVGSRRDIARKWSQSYHFPLALHEQDDLPQVAQFLTVNQSSSFPREELADYVTRKIAEELGDATLVSNTLDALIAEIGRRRRDAGRFEPYQVLAQLKLPMYITTDPSSLLADALLAGGAHPEVEICRWSESLDLAPSIFEREPDYRPSPERPLVFHLFGRLDNPDSIVLTEDDYFDYLIGVTSHNDLIPPVVRRALVDTALLFVGFRLDEWDFRVLFRSIMNREARLRLSKYAHIAAQVNPEEGLILEPERARRFLESYFQNAGQINLYWGQVEDFLRELDQRWRTPQI